MTNLISNPPGDCCARGVKHTGKAVGTITTLKARSSVSQKQVEAYITYPANKSTHTAILFLTDIIGHNTINAQLLADQYAADGYFVVVPDLFEGDAVPLNRPGDYDLPSWLQKHPTNLVDPIVEATLGEMRDTFNCQRIGAVGYCFGAKYVARFLGQGKINVGYVAHPSFVEEAELAAIKGPLSIAAAEHDTIFPPEKRHHAEVILPKTGQAWQIALYGGVSHGFAVRADISIKSNKIAKEHAYYQAVQWFDSYLKSVE
ncbi:dienelactone hydrolase family protein [Xylona heveae TC161]|uniref:Dienelactone hydrolase family protein n=1 Tax=Xylona heveae (strain CBS 132557 / TC161) TaxID=1328760 RepID=A0A165A9D8_XYLHT|nr:dienelactone hydrolase family protein [Xylona heveae TC161]KZF20126.1 dienelactone hydrolase family protein [Xylona heveae TC161]